MSRTFDISSPVVDLEPRSDPIASGKRRSILWPVLAFKILVPRRTARPLHLFQEFVLKLCRAGVTDRVEINERLALGPNLTDVVLAQLKGDGLLTDNHTPTDRGLRLVIDVEEEEVEADTGFVYVDPFNGELWDRFTLGDPHYAGASRLPQKREVPGSYVRWWSGSIGKPLKGEALAVVPPSPLPSVRTPAPHDILRALRGDRWHRSAYEHWDRRSRGGRKAAEDDRQERRPIIERVSMLSDEPESLFLLTYLFTPKEMTPTGTWQICDPFGLGPNADLRRQVEGLVHSGQQPGLAHRIKELTGEAYTVQTIDVREIIEAQHRDAVDEVRDQLGEAPMPYELLLSHLVWAEEGRLEYERLIAAGRTGRGARPMKLLTHIYTAMEELLAVVHTQYDASAAVSMLCDDPQANAEVLTSLAREMGLEDRPEGEADCLAGFLRMGRGAVARVAEEGRRDLRSQFGLLILQAQANTHHPLYRLAEMFPNCVQFLVKLKRLRDAATHGTGRGRDACDPVGVREELYRCARLLLPDAGRRAAGPADCTAELETWQAEVVHRLRAQAVSRVEHRIGPDIRRFSRLWELLVDAQHRAIELEKMRAEGDRSLDLTGRITQFAISSCGALEAAMQALLQAGVSADPPELLTDQGGRVQFLAKVASGMGFEVDGDNELPAAISTVYWPRVLKAAKYAEGTAGALLVALLLSASKQERHPFRELARRRRYFLQFVSDVITIRGHGNRTELPLDRVDEVAGELMETIEEIVDLFP